MPAERLLDPTIGDSQKVAQLSALEYRVWTIYLIAADDYGVLPCLASKIQGADRWCAEQDRGVIQAALERLCDVAIVRRFEIRGDAFICSLRWQKYQHIRRPRRSHYPTPPADVLAECDKDTAALFSKKSPADDSGNISEVPQHFGISEIFPKFGNSSACSRAPAGASNSYSNSNSSSNSFGEGLETPLPDLPDAPFDVWLLELTGQYPPQAVTNGRLTHDAFLDVFRGDPRAPPEVIADVLAHLDNQKRGYQWRVKRMIPKLEKWLREGLWQQLHDETPPTALVSEKTLAHMTAAEAFVKGATRGAH